MDAGETMPRSKTHPPDPPLATAITEEELTRALGEMITPILSVPESERAGWYRSMERLSRIKRDDALYPTTKLAGLWIKIANLTWPNRKTRTRELRGRDPSEGWVREPPSPAGTMAPRAKGRPMAKRSSSAEAVTDRFVHRDPGGRPR